MSEHDEGVAVAATDVRVEYRLQSRASRKGSTPSGQRRGRTARSFRAVNGVSFVAREGETIGIVGHNGSGKSTLLRAVAGLIPVTSGSILATSTPVLLGIGAALKPDLTGRQNIVLGGTALGISRKVMLDQLDDIIEFSGLGGSIDRLFRTYSSGMKARLQFSVSTAVQPAILLVDEALSVGDEEFKERSNERIQELVGGASTVFLVSHSLGTIAQRCDRAIWLDQGNQRAIGPAADIVAEYQHVVDERRKERQRARRASLDTAGEARNR